MDHPLIDIYDLTMAAFLLFLSVGLYWLHKKDLI